METITTASSASTGKCDATIQLTWCSASPIPLLSGNEPARSRSHLKPKTLPVPRACTKRSVSFSKLEIREHAIIVGDHPSCTSGLPLSLGWKHSPDSTVMEIDEYETIRGPRKTGELLKLNHFERKNLLKKVAGLNETELKKAERKNRVIQRQMGL
mmetsp:Transcript_20977/g.25975  ORF Transcript_20977/g.25975 Transcript_20977/m.25975 type:complete len:156 (-) Transcript_20977:105-572(-)